ncbi:MAG: M14 family zinc carboxypeptidase [Myxococcota bacterium]|nr:M14 family zinc carboxypeptidase [Myxococcota bacterium]
MGLLYLLTTAVLADVVGEAWVYAPEPEDRKALASEPVGFAEGVRNGWVRVHGTEQELDHLSDIGFTIADRRNDHRVPRFLSGEYHTPETMVIALEGLVDAHPEQAQLIQIGESVEGRPIIGIRIGQSESSSWRILGAHHGDELTSAELSLEIARAALEEAPGFEGLLRDQELFIVPHVNPDGVAAGSRYNAHGVDLNRNYGFQWSSLEYRPGTAAFSEPETRSVRMNSLNSSFLAGLSVHSGATNLGYVWNWTISPTIDTSLLEKTGQRYLEACELPGFWLTNGAEWYVTNGDTNDWSYAAQGILDYTLEVSAIKTPPPSEIDRIVAAHLPASAAWLTSPTPLRGTTRDAVSTNPIPATLEVVGATPPFHSHPIHGGFSRILEPGSYTLQVQAPGYQSQEIEIALAPEESLSLEISLERNALSEVHPEPRLLSRGQSTIELRLPGLSEMPETLTFYRPGLEPQSFPREGDHYRVDPSDLTAGPWTLIAGETVLPRAVFAGNLSERVRVESFEETEEGARLDGAGFAQGTEIFAISGADRSAHPVELTTWNSSRLELDFSSLPEGEEVDLWILSNGAEVAVIDILTTQGLDTAAPPDTGGEDTGETGERGPRKLELTPVSTCSTSSPWSPSALWVLLLAGLSRRPSRCRATPPHSC